MPTKYEMRERLMADGGTRLAPVAVNVCCHVCDERLKPLFKGDSADPDTWIYRECDTCLEPVCARCGDTNAEGYVQCSDCYQNEAICRTAVV